MTLEVPLLATFLLRISSKSLTKGAWENFLPSFNSILLSSYVQAVGFPGGAQFSSVQLFSHVRLFVTMDYSTPGLPVHHQLPEFTQTHDH